MDALKLRLRDGSLVFCLLPIAYFLLYGFHGYADTDQGFVPGLAWRITGGQMPYLDFAYVRPPLTPYLHAAEMLLWPRSLEMIGMRLDFYLMLWASVLWGVLALRRHVDFHALGFTPWMLGTLAFIFGVHNFPAMPWHTVDGVFFGSLGIYLVSHPHARWRMTLGLSALALAGLAKQPFVILLPVGIVMLFVLHPPKVALKVTSVAVLGLLAVGMLLIYGLLPPGFVTAMLRKTMGASSSGELLQAGFLDYLWPGGALAATAVGLVWWLRKRPWAQTIVACLGIAILVFVAVYPMVMAGLGFWKMTFMPPRIGFYHGLLLLVLPASIGLWRDGNRPAAVALLGMGAVAWASSLSWGYPVPALFALPGLFALLYLLHQLPRPVVTLRRLAWVAVAALIGFWGLQQFPYRDSPRWELQTGAGEIFPALTSIRTSPENLAKLQEYKTMRTRYPEAIVLPAMPAADYLMGLHTVWPIDWEHDGEAGSAAIAASFATYGGVSEALVELARSDEAHSPNPLYKSTILEIVLAQWVPGEHGVFFQRYTSPTKPSAN